MQILILSDIHANWHALQAVLDQAAGSYDQIVCCGDIVGYNPQPARVLEWVRTHCAATIRGNHDKVVAGIDDLEWFNPVAQAAARWTISQLDADAMKYLRELRQGPLLLEHFAICHGSPRDEDEYITSSGEAADVFPHLDLPLTFFGHTHLQGGFFLQHRRIGPLPTVPSTHEEAVIEITPDTLYLVNPGSVGQPRDADPRAAYALFDSVQRTVTLRRVSYPIESTALEIQKAGLPDVLALRLFQGR
ncbi:MAG TPA: metallophosphoesterase family protein [Bryobacteraceae bacterium]